MGRLIELVENMGRYNSLAPLLVFWELLRIAVAVPYALHQLVVVDTAGDALIRLNGYDQVVASNKVRPL